jgi:hypothetical protein
MMKTDLESVDSRLHGNDGQRSCHPGSSFTELSGIQIFNINNY